MPGSWHAFFEDGPQRRSGDKHGWRSLVRANAYRDFWLLAITALCLWALVQQHGTLQRVQESRRVAIGATCAVMSSISEAGRNVIEAASAGPDTPFTRNLERLGYPPPTVRRRSAHAAATAYVDGIALRVERAIGHRGVALVKANGTINCAAFQRLAGTQH